MNLWQSLGGSVRFEILVSDPAATLTLLHQQGILLENVEFIDELTVRFSVKRTDAKRIITYAERGDHRYKILEKAGFYWKLAGFRHRLLLMSGLVFMMLFTILLPTRVLFYRVEGNSMIPDKKIVEIVSQSGIPFGASRRQIRSEKVKNTLLGAIPELEWVGINTAGCVATISVRERQFREPINQSQGITSIVAVREGVVQTITTTSGTPACKPGQAVKAGQVLISGYTDCGISIRAQRARGEVYAITQRNITMQKMENNVQRGHKTSKTQKIGLLIGKKRIFFFQGSGNLDTSCDKMYVEKYVTLPGGFILPLAIVTETYSYYEEAEYSAGSPDVTHLSELAKKHLLSSTVAGKILLDQESVSCDNGCIYFQGEYACLEMIGRERIEEIIKP